MIRVTSSSPTSVDMEGTGCSNSPRMDAEEAAGERDRRDGEEGVEGWGGGRRKVKSVVGQRQQGGRKSIGEGMEGEGGG